MNDKQIGEILQRTLEFFFKHNPDAVIDLNQLVEAEEWIQQNFLMQPVWKNAPDWAQYWAKDSDGKSYWYEVEPTRTKIIWWIDPTDRSGRTEYCAEETEGWEDSLRQRPQDSA